MEDKEGVDPLTEFTSDSSWALTGGPDSVSDTFNYFFDRESDILREFEWNLQPDHTEEIDRFYQLDRIDSSPDLAGNSFGVSKSFAGGSGGASASCVSGSVMSSNPGGSADVLMSNPSMSSSSSEDLPEKYTGSGGKPSEIP